MASVAITINGMLYDKLNRTQQSVVLMGQASLTDLTIGGGPIYPPDQPPVGQPPGIWPGPGDPDFPGGGQPPLTIWGGRPGPWDGSWVPPQPSLPPNVTPPEPGSPPVIVAGPPGVVNPIVPPPYIVVRYPGVGLVVVPQPTQSAPAPEKK